MYSRGLNGHMSISIGNKVLNKHGEIERFNVHPVVGCLVRRSGGRQNTKNY